MTHSVRQNCIRQGLRNLLLADEFGERARPITPRNNDVFALVIALKWL
jgi:hypothetical protein